MAPRPIIHTCDKEGDISAIKANMANVEKSISRIENKIDTFINKADEIYVTKEGHKSAELNIENTQKRVSDIESNINKLVWLIIAFVITAVLTVIFKY